MSGLSTAAVVRLNEIEVGRVAKIDLDPGGPNIGKSPPAGAGHDSCSIPTRLRRSRARDLQVSATLKYREERAIHLL